MFNLGLNAAEQDAYHRALASSHTRRFRVQVTNLDQAPLEDVSSRVVDGEVTVDWSGEEATRALSVAMIDPNYSLGFDSADGGSGMWFFDRMLQVYAVTPVPELGMTVECPIFTGPIRKFKRAGDIVTLDGVGKDVFARKAWPRIILPKGMLVLDGIRHVMEQLGEAFFKIDFNSTARFAGQQVVDRNLQASPFGWCRMQATAIGARLYYDGAGYLRIRPNSVDQPEFTFRDGDGGYVLSDPTPEGDFTELANVVRAEGPNRNGVNPYYEAFVDQSSALHPSKLSRNGKPLYMGVIVQQDSISDNKMARSVAESELKRRQFVATSVAFDSLPLYSFEESDVGRVVVDDFTTTFQATKFKFGFSAGAVMPIGYDKNISPKLARIRRF